MIGSIKVSKECAAAAFRIRKRQRFMFKSVLLTWSISMLCAITPLEQLDPRAQGIKYILAIAILALGTIATIVTTVRLIAAKCPRCQSNLFRKGLSVNALRTECQHCGLPLRGLEAGSIRRGPIQ